MDTTKFEHRLCPELKKIKHHIIASPPNLLIDKLGTRKIKKLGFNPIIS